MAVVDQYGPGRDLPFEWTSPKLKPGKHTIRLKLLEKNTPPSKDRFINIAGFDILRGEGRFSMNGTSRELL